MATQTVPGVFFSRSAESPPLPIVIDSPHSGFDYPPDFCPVAPVAAVLTSCDRFVDELWGAAPQYGATLVAALFPRAYIDPNRSAADIDPELLDETWPGTGQASDYTRRGMGLIRRYALPGIPLYERKLTVTEVQNRLSEYYIPYRKRIGTAIEEAFVQHGAVWHCNCHSMKPQGNAMNTDAGNSRPDFVLSDRLGKTCDGRFTDWLAGRFKRRGYSVKINDPYQGGDLVATFGRPALKRNSVQIEINRALYLDGMTFQKSPGFDRLAADLSGVLRELGEFVRAHLASGSEES